MSEQHPIDLTAGCNVTTLGTITSSPSWISQQALATQSCQQPYTAVQVFDRRRFGQISSANPENSQAEAMETDIGHQPGSSYQAPPTQHISIIIEDSSDDEDEGPTASHGPSVPTSHSPSVPTSYSPSVPTSHSPSVPTSHSPSVPPTHRDSETISIPLRYNRGPGLDCLYALEFPFVCSDNYKIVKVGASNKPGRRLLQIRQAFNAQSESPDFHCLTESPIRRDMANKEVIQFAKLETEVLFIMQYWVPAGRMVEAERNEAEQHIRNAIGRPASREFTNAFVGSARDSFRVKAVCGLSEWILCKKEMVEAIKVAFRNGQLDGDNEKAWGSWRGFVDKLKQIKQLPCVTVDYIFGAGEKTFTHNIPLPP